MAHPDAGGRCSYTKLPLRGMVDEVAHYRRLRVHWDQCGDGADRTSGEEIVVVDNLSRANVDRNLARLRKLGIECHIADIRDQHPIGQILAQHIDTDVVLHLAGQVSLVASIADPFDDFDVNARGTMILLEEVRRLLPDAVVLYSSTNKVYGDLRHLRVAETPSRYVLPDRANGISEIEPLDFHGGYGCSKGAADQYMLEYHRSYGLKTVVLRQSSVYGGNQYATADQGWIAYFIRQAVIGNRCDQRLRVAGPGCATRG